jgi:hypothetical protein
MSLIHHTKRQLKIFNKMGQLISTLTSTFYEASAAEEEDRRRCRGRGDNTEDGAVDFRLAPFAVAQSSERAQLVVANGTGQRGHLCTQIERVTF